MASWGVDEAKARLSLVLDSTEAAGSQFLRRSERTYVVTTQEEIEKRCEGRKEGRRSKFVSVADAVRPTFDERYDVQMMQDENGNRWMDFG